MISKNNKFIKDNIAALNMWKVWKFMAVMEHKKKFRGSFIGSAWPLVNLSITTAILTLVYGTILNQPLNDFMPRLLVGLTIWNYLTRSLLEGSFAFTSSAGYIKQLCCPKQIYLWKSWLCILISFKLELLFCVLVSLFFGKITFYGLIVSSIGLLNIITISYFHILLTGYLGGIFLDLHRIISSIIPLLFLVTPVMFSRQFLELHKIDFIYFLNPFSHMIDILRIPLLTSHLAPFESYCISFAYICVVCIFGLYFAFKLDNKIVYYL
ncbi:MAG: ABC transporter permease [Candidatus Riflebacteria bacterium]|nr:ABC transporter permease [Candidatus Riflebacteria bacterium]